MNQTFVRIYEQRIDLLRAVIIGPQGTPYHSVCSSLTLHSLVNISIYKPPMVTYRSYGLRLNPNLFSNGYVCLSLLNTWDGQGHEPWNLPTWEALFKAGNNWENYSQNVFVLSCETVLFLLRSRQRILKVLWRTFSWAGTRHVKYLEGLHEWYGENWFCFLKKGHLLRLNAKYQAYSRQ